MPGHGLGELRTYERILIYNIQLARARPYDLARLGLTPLTRPELGATWNDLRLSWVDLGLTWLELCVTWPDLGLTGPDLKLTGAQLGLLRVDLA